MDIRFYATKTNYAERRSPAPTTDRTRPVAEKAAGDYDKVTFNRPSASADDVSFARMLAQEVSAHVAKGTDPKHLAAVSQQVMSGTYSPDSRRIAEHILGYR